MSLTQTLSSRPKHRASAMRSGETPVFPPPRPISVILSEAQRSRRTPKLLTSPMLSSPFRHNRAREFVVASEIGPGFSPDNTRRPTNGFSPWDKPSSVRATNRYPKADSPALQLRVSLGLITAQEKRGFSPWGMPSPTEATTP